MPAGCVEPCVKRGKAVQLCHLSHDCHKLLGTTRLLAGTLAARLVANMSEIHCDRYGTGFFSYLRAGRDAMRKSHPVIAVEDAHGCLDHWYAVSGRGLIPWPRCQAYQAGLEAVPPPHPKAQVGIASLPGRAPDAWLPMLDKGVNRGAHTDEIEEFIRDLALKVS